MDELKFVCKCFLFAGILVALSQVKMSGLTIETHVQSALVSSQTADFVNKAAQGGVKLLQDTFAMSAKKLNEWRYGTKEENKTETRKTASLKIVEPVKTKQASEPLPLAETAEPDEENLSEEF
jgi:hypothetical protein